MNFIYELRYALLPEILLTGLLIICCILSFLFKEQKTKLIHLISSGGLIIILLSLLILPFNEKNIAVYGSFVSDAYSILFRTLIIIGTLITLQFSKKYAANFGRSSGEFYTLILAAALGAMFLVGANDIILLFVALETLSISSFLLTGYTKSDKLSNEAALKYLVIGAASSAVLLYGFSFLYGITGQTNIADITGFLSKYNINTVLIVSFLLVMGGFCYKIAAVPFHTWTPDVYEGAPIPVTAFLSVVSKIAGFAVIIKTLSLIYSNLPVWSSSIAVIAVITMTVGNLMAINQTNIKRLMAYSSIAHTGYILTGLAILTHAGIAGIIFYLITYLFMNFGAWAAIEIFINKTGKDTVDSFDGLATKQPLLAFGFTICLLSLAGIPITAGFFGKFFLFQSIAMAGIQNYAWLLIIALINTVISVYYYLRIIAAMILKPSVAEYSEDIIKPSFSLNSVLAFTVLVTLLIGIFASPIYSISKYSASKINFIAPVKTLSEQK
jgi:NAD(P)H-quinone oxidoreductase subunit 2